MTDKELNDSIAQVLELADAEKQKYNKADLVLFAKQQILKGIPVSEILFQFFNVE